MSYIRVPHRATAIQPRNRINQSIVNRPLAPRFLPVLQPPNLFPQQQSDFIFEEQNEDYSTNVYGQLTTIKINTKRNNAQQVTIEHPTHYIKTSITNRSIPTVQPKYSTKTNLQATR